MATAADTGSGGILSYAQLEGVWLQASQGTQYATQTWAALMAAIAEAESRGNPNATNPTDNGGKQTSWGLWQISNGDHTQPSANWNNPLTNAQLALGKLQSQGLGAWGTYDSGAYAAFLNSSTTPDTSGYSAAADTSAATGSAAATAAQAEANCAWRINFNIPIIGGDLCIVSYSQIRAILAGGILVAGAGLALFAVASLLATSSPVQGLASAAASVIPQGRAVKAVVNRRPSSPSGTTPPPARPRRNVQPASRQRTGGPTQQKPTPRTGGRTQQGSQ